MVLLEAEIVQKEGDECTGTNKINELMPLMSPSNGFLQSHTQLQYHHFQRCQEIALHLVELQRTHEKRNFSKHHIYLCQIIRKTLCLFRLYR